MEKKHYRGVGVLGVIIGAASMVVVYASGMIRPAATLPATATVTLQNWRNNWSNGGETPVAGEGVLDYSQFEKIYGLLKAQYYDQEKISTGEMLEWALKGMVASLNDPYTTFLDVEQNTNFTEELKGEQDFEGIGAAVLKKNDAIEVQEVYKGTPSFEAGLRPLDLIAEINGEKTTDMTTDVAVSKIRGPKDTTVELTVIRPSETEAGKRVLTFKIVRKQVVIPSVTSNVFTVANKKVGYINISIIGQQTENAMKKAVAELKEQGISGLILDLRGNGGGFLDIGVKVASHFLAKGQAVTTTKYRDTGYNEIYYSDGYAEFIATPTIVLVDSLTASAGEIIAAALQEVQGARILGTKTYGKGSIQTITDFGSGAAIKYTIGKWYTPKDENVNGTGLIPDIEVPFDVTGYQNNKTDNQLERAKVEIVKMMN